MKLVPLNTIQKSKLLLLFVALVIFSCKEEKNCEETKCEGGYTKIYAPVCGCNDVTYSNSSEAECKGITSYTEGKCKEDNDCEEKECTGGYIEIYDPVCGCNNVTYSNSSEAECKGITSYTGGKCEKEDKADCEEKECNGSYIEIYDPVCGCNNVTYSNSSEAECKGITSYKQGKCKKKDESDCEEKKCTGDYLQIYDPVCGCNNVTYSNSSEAECKGITSYEKGKCKKKDESDCKEKECTGNITFEIDPVCGCNGTTYENPSHALCHGITSYKKGECKKKSCNNIDILSSEPRDAELEKNMKKWQSFNICNYSISSLIVCNCTEEYSTSKTLKIVNGKITHVGDKLYPDEELTNFKSVNEMFEFINELYSSEKHILNVSYDEKYGFPTYLYVDEEEMMVDEEISYEFSELTPFK
jgi:coxsackievirus/adenovirus receptor